MSEKDQVATYTQEEIDNFCDVLLWEHKVDDRQYKLDNILANTNDDN